MVILFFFFFSVLSLFIYLCKALPIFIYFSLRESFNRHQAATFTNMLTLRPNKIIFKKKGESKGEKSLRGTHKSQISNQDQIGIFNGRHHVHSPCFARVKLSHIISYGPHSPQNKYKNLVTSDLTQSQTKPYQTMNNNNKTHIV